MTKLIALAFCLLMVSDLCVAFERSHRYHRRFHQGKKTTTTTQLAFNNKWAKLAEGIMVGLTKNNTGWMECLPAEWRTEVPNPQENLLNQRFEAMGTVGRTILTVLDKAADLLCRFRSQVVRLFELFFDPSGKAFLQGQYGLRRRFRTRRQFFQWLSNQASSAANWVKDQVSSAANWTAAKVNEGLRWTRETVTAIWNQLKAPVQNFLNEIRDAITKVQTAIHSILNIVQQVKRIIDCLKSLKAAGQEIIKVYKGLVSKWTWLTSVAAGTGGVLTIPLIANIVIGIICQKNVFKAVIEDFLQANANPNVLQKFYLRGRALGTIIHTLGTATRRRYK